VRKGFINFGKLSKAALAYSVYLSLDLYQIPIILDQITIVVYGDIIVVITAISTLQACAVYISLACAYEIFSYQPLLLYLATFTNGL
jgi:hypothetical protein